MLKADKITYKHRDYTILNKVDFSILPGQMIAIVGPNGAGKSSLLSYLSNEMTSKNVFFKEVVLDKWNISELSHHKAKFSQHNSTDIPLLVEDVVLMGRYPYFSSKPSEIDLNAVELAMQKTDVFKLKSRDYNTLSGGEKQRVHLARALSQLDNDINEKLLFLDEPLNNLDVLHQHKILKTIDSFTKKGNAAVVVMHDLNLAAQFADIIFLMKRGEVVACDTPNKVFTKEIISDVYNFPCMIFQNPLNNHPMIVFGEN